MSVQKIAAKLLIERANPRNRVIPFFHEGHKPFVIVLLLKAKNPVTIAAKHTQSTKPLPRRYTAASERIGQDTSFFCPVSEQFPGRTAPTEFAEGVEKLVRAANA